MIEEALRDYFKAEDSRRRMTAIPRSVAPVTVEVSICLLLNDDLATFHCFERLVDAVQHESIEILAACISADTASRIQAYFPNVEVVIAETLDTALHESLAQRARSDTLLFLFGSFEVLPTLGLSLISLARDPRIRNVILGGSVIDVHGRLRQAGVSVKAGQSTLDGFNDDASRTTWQSIQGTDGFAGAPLAFSRALFEALGKFGASPAKASFLHLSLAAAKAGIPSLWHPALAVIDWASTEDFCARMRTDVPSTAIDASASLAMRTRGHRVLVIEDRVPHVRMGRGYPRSREMITSLVELGHGVTLYSMREPQEEAVEVYSTLTRGVELIEHTELRQLARRFAESLHDYDLVVVARPYNMRVFRKVLDIAGLAFPTTRPAVIYDAEALFSLREIAQRDLADAMSPEERDRKVADEIELTKDCAAVFSVSALEAAHFQARSNAPVFTLAHALRLQPTATPFEDRRGFMFVGALVDPLSPNVRGLLWFLDEVVPLIRQSCRDSDLPEFIVGEACDAVKQACGRHDAQALVVIHDLSSIYETSRVFIAPSLFAAGIPLKILEATAMGIPVVASDLLVNQLVWTDETKLLSAVTASAFAQACVRLHGDSILWDNVRRAALTRVQADASPEVLRHTINEAINTALNENRLP